MNKNAIDRTELLEMVTLPLGNISRTLAFLLQDDFDIDVDTLRAGLLLVQADAECAYNFLVDEVASSERRIEPRTPNQLRQLVSLMGAPESQGTRLLQLRTLSDIR